MHLRPRPNLRPRLFLCAALVVLASGEHRVASAAQVAALKIAVVEGEGAVNIIQQKTAVAPVIEVRDRNDQPVAGAVVKFAITKGRASFGGARTLSVTTNAAGRATAAGLTPIGSGPLRIAATAAFQGQTAAVSIAQTSVMTATEASSLASVPTAPVSGGGLSHLAVAAIAGGAGAGIAGALLASQSAGGPSSVQTTTYSGSFSGEMNVTSTLTGPNQVFTCVRTNAIRGILTMQLKALEATVTGMAQANGTKSELAVSGPQCIPVSGTLPFNFNGPVTGSAAGLAFRHQTSSTGTTDIGATISSTDTFTFSGALNGGVISGTITYSQGTQGTQTSPFPGVISGGGSTTFPVTLR